MGIFIENEVFEFETKKNELVLDEFFAKIDAV